MEIQWKVDYKMEFDISNAIGYYERLDMLVNDLSYLWSELYRDNVNAPSAICRFQYGDFTFIFDDTGELIANGTVSADEVPEGRVVAAFGISKTNMLPRNTYRMRTYLGSTQKVYSHFGNDYDKGHFMANATGGPLEINLFPQKRAINRGWSEDGKLYRAMEKFVAGNPGTFVFSRPVYKDFSLRPVGLEFGYLSLDGNFEVNYFPNI
jgi:hypothetical protein